MFGKDSIAFRSLVRFAAEDPDDEARRLLVADWCDEQGFPEVAEYFRSELGAAMVRIEGATLGLAKTARPVELHLDSATAEETVRIIELANAFAPLLEQVKLLNDKHLPKKPP